MVRSGRSGKGTFGGSVFLAVLSLVASTGCNNAPQPFEDESLESLAHRAARGGGKGQPRMVSFETAVDRAIGPCGEVLSDSASTAFGSAFDEQVAKPLLSDLRDILFGDEERSDKWNTHQKSKRRAWKTLQTVERQLKEVKDEMADIVADSFRSMFDPCTTVPQIARSVDPLYRTDVPEPSLDGFAGGVGPVVVSAGQTAADVLERGFRPGLIAVEFTNIDTTCQLGGQAEVPGPVFAETKVSGSATATRGDGMNPPKANLKLNLTVSGNVGGQQASVKLEAAAEFKGGGAGGSGSSSSQSVSVTFEIKF